MPLLSGAVQQSKTSDSIRPIGPVRSLARRLGYAAQDRLVIVNCDDLGVSAAANAAIERALRTGSASSAGLMVPCPHAEDAARTCRDLDIGIHLTLNAEYATYRWRPLTEAPSLLDADGYLPRSPSLLAQKADIRDIEYECRAQIERAFEWGIDITHLNSHMDVMQSFPAYFDIYVRLGIEYRLPIRLVRPRFAFIRGRSSAKALDRAHVVTTDHFVSPPWGETARHSLERRGRKLPKGVSEFSLHPVDDGTELRSYDTEFANLRASDARSLRDGTVLGALSARGAKIIGFKPLRDLMRGGLQMAA